MKAGRIALGAASLRLSFSQVVAPHLRGGLREITSLEVVPGARRKGQATALMQEVCDQADEHKVTLMLSPNPFGVVGMTAAQLADWYAERFGFFKLQDNPPLLVRLPYQSQPLPAPYAVPRAVSLASGDVCAH